LLESLDQALSSPQAALTGSLPRVCNIKLNKIEGNGSGRRLVDKESEAELSLLSQELQKYMGTVLDGTRVTNRFYRFGSLVLISSL
jgi:hypothetical protein